VVIKEKGSANYLEFRVISEYHAGWFANALKQAVEEYNLGKVQ